MFDDGDEGRGSQSTVEIVREAHAYRWTLEIQDDVCARSVPLDVGPIVIGASRSADVALHDPTASARHCEVGVMGSGVVVRDLGSRNGTYVAGARVNEAWATEGTVVTIGRTTAIFRARAACDGDDDAAPLDGVAGQSLAMRRVASRVRRLARMSAPVLVSGETGVGKELIAHALHREAPRRGRFVAVNVAALPRELVESEMFGHERGAFTGAVQRRAGAFAEATHGTLFLDEIGELPIEAQPKLLRALDGYDVRRVGGSAEPEAPRARVVAATHAPLHDRVVAGTFRRDLYHRLEVFVVEVPPLRARKGDILPIARAILASVRAELGERELAPAAVARLAAHDWPGNVRELRNVLLRAVDAAADARMLDSGHVDAGMRVREQPALTLTPSLAKDWLVRHSGNVSAAARAAGIPRTTFRKLLAQERTRGEP